MVRPWACVRRLMPGQISIQGFSCFIICLIAALVERDARTYPALVLVEVDSHHFALAHPHQIINENWVGFVIRPDKHHSDFRLGFRALRSPNSFCVLIYLCATS